MIGADAIARFASKFARGDEDQCWLWTGAKNQRGYGFLSVNGRAVRAHRIAFELAKGPIPQGAEIMHRCDQPSCVNPAHLRAGTHEDNMKDMATKGRAQPHHGSQNGSAVLDEEAVRRIRNSHETHAALSRMYGVTTSQIWNVRKYRSWKHVHA